MLDKLAQIRKAIAAAVGVALTALTFAHTLTFLPGSWTTSIGVLLAVLTPIATYLTPNAAPAK